MTRVQTGLDALTQDGFQSLKGKSIGVVCNQASINANLDHVLDLLHPLHQSGFLRVASVFGPQHGLRGHTQDNMIEWEGGDDGDRGWRVFSLYGENREPTDPMLEGVELLLVDLQDVGARYYTFVWTLSLCMKACAQRGIPMLVLDRPNPIGGDRTEGPYSDPAFASFVGLHPILVRHGLTMGELAVWLQAAHYPEAKIKVQQLENWKRSMSFSQTGLPWLPPSPNMPTPDTAEVYPGGCLIEATNLSEGRGTTRPFEIVGASYLDSDRYCAQLNRYQLPGVKFLPYDFQPTFHKHAGLTCGGSFLYVTDRTVFESVLATTAMLLTACHQAPDAFAWRDPPYEYEYVKPPIDILAGGAWYREWIEADRPLKDFRDRFAEDERQNPLDRFWIYR